MFIQTEDTPNPNATKFFPNQEVSPDSPVYFKNIESAANKSTLAVKLFNIGNVEAVFFGSDFITISKSKTIDWSIIKPEILTVIMDHFLGGNSVFDTQQYTHANFSPEELSDIEKQIVEIIETRVRPSVAMDGGDIVYRGFEGGIVKLELRGSCSGCPSSTITLKKGIESMLKHFIPEVRSVEAVSEHAL
jgi:Fe-S cluster biogenesis protein NfuA